MPGYTEAVLAGQINHFSQGQFVVVAGEKVVGYCATLQLAENRCMKPHTWTEITDNGYASTHNPKGEWLYGMEVFVASDYRG